MLLFILSGSPDIFPWPMHGILHILHTHVLQHRDPNFGRDPMQLYIHNWYIYTMPLGGGGGRVCVPLGDLLGLVDQKRIQNSINFIYAYIPHAL